MEREAKGRTERERPAAAAAATHRPTAAARTGRRRRSIAAGDVGDSIDLAIPDHAIVFVTRCFVSLLAQSRRAKESERAKFLA